MNNLFSEYEPIVVIGESSIYNLFFRHNLILVILNKLKVMSTSDGNQNFKNRFSFVSNSLTTGSLILESPFAAVVQCL